MRLLPVALAVIKALFTFNVMVLQQRAVLKMEPANCCAIQPMIAASLSSMPAIVSSPISSV